jgi:hypothetical protein
MSAPSSASNLSMASGKSPLIHGLKSEEEESNDTTGDVIVELDAGEDYDEDTNTASECADDLRDLCPSSVRAAAGRFGAMTAEHAVHA